MSSSQREPLRRRQQHNCAAQQPTSLAQLMACTNMPRGFLRNRSASRGGSMATVRMALKRSVPARPAFSYRRSIRPPGSYQ